MTTKKFKAEKWIRFALNLSLMWAVIFLLMFVFTAILSGIIGISDFGSSLGIPLGSIGIGLIGLTVVIFIVSVIKWTALGALYHFFLMPTLRSFDIYWQLVGLSFVSSVIIGLFTGELNIITSLISALVGMFIFVNLISFFKIRTPLVVRKKVKK